MSRLESSQFGRDEGERPSSALPRSWKDVTAPRDTGTHATECHGTFRILREFSEHLAHERSAPEVDAAPTRSGLQSSQVIFLLFYVESYVLLIYFDL